MVSSSLHADLCTAHYRQTVPHGCQLTVRGDTAAAYNCQRGGSWRGRAGTGSRSGALPTAPRACGGLRNDAAGTPGVGGQGSRASPSHPPTPSRTARGASRRARRRFVKVPSSRPAQPERLYKLCGDDRNRRQDGRETARNRADGAPGHTAQAGAADLSGYVVTAAMCRQYWNTVEQRDDQVAAKPERLPNCSGHWKQTVFTRK